ncbi:Membrane protein involved in the export of O-antigen and teichoic acid [Haladaptatus litoreus]|uniref:Membrane protein involved in the export of O-antigen and teichoic acid n=1 Tax=Haladaptatus litoreus TaxID=553468 RepID=A0A1N6YSW7_9EURY|nr:polysaccharide biosynthesis C-terminal domain-containing protein [Haladaptatus litoreus]SIR17656.1 Membrane protein involved in the export of O-antigen and teichoic acid [Haladaptatus litoreus]
MTEATDVNLGSETAKATIAKFAMAATGFFASILFARELGPTMFGGYYLLFGATKLADRPLTGWATASKKRFSEDATKRREIIGAQFLFNAVWILFASGVALLLADNLRSYSGLTMAPLLFVILLVSESNYESFDRVLKARGQIGIATWIDALRSYLTLPLQIVFVFVFAGYGADGMVYGLVGATAVTFPIIIFYLRVRPTIPSLGTLRSLFRYARYSIPTDFFATLYNRFDMILLGVLLVPATAANYEVAAQLTMPATFVATLAGSGLMPRVSRLASEGRTVGQEITNTISFASILAIPILFGALSIPKALVVTVYGPKYTLGASLIAGIAAYRFVSTQTTPLSQTMNGLDRPDVNMRISSIALAANILLGVVLTHQFGAIGVVVATIVAESFIYVSTAYVVKREVPSVKLFPRPLRTQIGVGALMFFVVSAVGRVVVVRSWFDLGILLAVGVTTYVGVLLVVSPAMRTTVGSVLDGSRLETYIPRRFLNW